MIQHLRTIILTGMWNWLPSTHARTSQPTIVPTLGVLAPSSGLYRCQYTWHIDKNVFNGSQVVDTVKCNFWYVWSFSAFCINVNWWNKFFFFWVFKDLKKFVFCLRVYVWYLWRSNEGIGFPGVTDSCAGTMSMLGAKPGSSARAINTLSHGVISSTSVMKQVLNIEIILGSWGAMETAYG